MVVTRGSPEEHATELEKVLNRLEQHGYRASAEKSKLFQTDVESCGYQINASGVKPKKTRREAVTKIEAPKTVREVRSFLGSIQYLAKFIGNLSAASEPMKKLLREETKWKWGAEKDKAIDQMKRDIANIADLKHYNLAAETVLTTNASTKAWVRSCSKSMREEKDRSPSNQGTFVALMKITQSRNSSC